MLLTLCSEAKVYQMTFKSEEFIPQGWQDSLATKGACFWAFVLGPEDLRPFNIPSNHMVGRQIFLWPPLAPFQKVIVK